jgi:hypothetical protein
MAGPAPDVRGSQKAAAQSAQKLLRELLRIRVEFEVILSRFG